jgi:hypothetical protein
VLERRQRAQRAALKGLGAVPLPASLGGSFFGGSAAGGGAAVAGMGIGAKIATVLAAGIVATGVGREAVEAVQARSAPTSSRAAAVHDNPAFSSASTRGRVGAGPIATRSKKRPRKADRKTSRFRQASKSMHGIAAARPGTSPTGGTQQSDGSASTPAVVQPPRVTPPAIQVPPVPQLPVQVPPVQVPPVPVPPLPQLPVPPPPPIIP